MNAFAKRIPKNLEKSEREDLEDIATVYTNIFIKVVRWLRIDTTESLDDERCL